MAMESTNPVTKSEIETYILERDYMQVEIVGQMFRCRVGERSHMDGLYTKRINADRALRSHVGTVIEQSRKQIAKREANKNAKKKQS